ncbi:hypothetical protein [Flagellimonas flava]|uniref:hypothetical protein n=1 Tax=Flagellimonas flava TaxID=570519 RepID=UPI003D652DC0
MKLLYRFNLVVYITTLLLHLTIFYGLLAQILLGVLQVASSFALLFAYPRFKPQGINHLTNYYIVVVLYGLAAIAPPLFNENLDDYLAIVMYMVLPMAIASYFIWITYRYYQNSYS